METKLFPVTINPSGKTLLVFLILLLISGAIILNTRDFSLASALVLSATVSAIMGYIVIPILQRLKAGQVIREDGPQKHLQKAGTPTMGGIFFIPVGVAIALLWGGLEQNLIAVSLVTLAYGGIGFLDDWQILAKKSNKGISPKMKLTLQIGVAIAFCLWMLISQPTSITTVSLPGKILLPLGLLFWPLAGFAMTAETNATNLTDGIDGLAAGVGAIAMLGLAAIVTPVSPQLTIFSACISGACLGFVVHNHNPAKVFMGDTGSLAIGAALASVGIISGNLWQLFIISGIFFVESLSVIAQVSYYKATKDSEGKGKRLLKMAPIHHHLELSDWSETQIVGVFYLIQAFLVILAILFH